MVNLQKESDTEDAEYLQCKNGDQIREGMSLIDGDVDPHDLLKVRAQVALAEYLLNEIQEVYRLQGVKINDKHIEVSRQADVAKSPE